MQTYQSIIDNMRLYSTNINEELIKKAYLFALDKHGTQTRDSGDIYFSHPLSVAEILIDLKMDQDTIISALLHDTVEDTNTTIKEIKSIFGNDIAKIVDGVTKISKLETNQLTDKKTENYKKLLLAAASDIRVLIIKLADRLHNIRTLKFKKCKAKRKEIAKETIEVYSQLAARIGMGKIQEELQDTSFLELYPDLYTSIHNKLKVLYESSDEVITNIKTQLEETLSQLNIKYTINGRLKTPYSIWNKMNIRTISFDQLSDIMAFRIIVNTITDCYSVLGLLHKAYLVVPGRFRDYISIPKSNQYQSLHTCIIGPFKKRIEIQIRTYEMHQISEYGIASHWEYKEGTHNNNYQWLKNMVQILDNTSKMEDFIEYSKTEMFTEGIFAITPKGSIIPLPKGASALDFAYAIHTEIGNSAIKAKINNHEKPLNTLLENGDQIEIITDANSKPNINWLSYVNTIKAKTEIKQFIANTEISEIELNGKSIFNTLFKENNIAITEDDQQKLLNQLKLNSIRQLYIALGDNTLKIEELITKYNALGGKQLNNIKNIKTNAILGISPSLSIIPTSCCSPIPGDKLYGVISLDDSTIAIHIEECTILKESLRNINCRIIDLYWNTKHTFEHERYTAKLILSAISQKEIIPKISNILERRNSSLVKLKICETFNNVFEYYVECQVTNFAQLSTIVADLMALDSVTEVKRV